jgi:hypothetical protein
MSLTSFDWRVDDPHLQELPMEGSVLVSRAGIQSSPSADLSNTSMRSGCAIDSLIHPNSVIRHLPKELCGMIRRLFLWR